MKSNTDNPFDRSGAVGAALKEPSTFAGLGLVFNGIADCMGGNYSTGVPNLVLGLVAIFKREVGSNGQ